MHGLAKGGAYPVNSSHRRTGKCYVACPKKRQRHCKEAARPPCRSTEGTPSLTRRPLGPLSRDEWAPIRQTGQECLFLAGGMLVPLFCGIEGPPSVRLQPGGRLAPVSGWMGSHPPHCVHRQDLLRWPLGPPSQLPSVHACSPNYRQAAYLGTDGLSICMRARMLPS